MHSWAPSQRPGLKYQTKDNPLIRDVFPAALQNVELFEATVALCLSFKAASQGLQSRVFRKSLHHKGQALVGIRNKLTSGAVDEAVILATVFLMIIDVSGTFTGCLQPADSSRMSSTMFELTKHTSMVFERWSKQILHLMRGDVPPPSYL